MVGRMYLLTGDRQLPVPLPLSVANVQQQQQQQQQLTNSLTDQRSRSPLTSGSEKELLGGELEVKPALPRRPFLTPPSLTPTFSFLLLEGECASTGDVTVSPISRHAGGKSVLAMVINLLGCSRKAGEEGNGVLQSVYVESQSVGALQPTK